MSSALEQIIRWAQELPAWQADAVRRLLEQGELTSSDRAALYQMLKASSGIDVQSSIPVFPKVGGFSGTGKGDEAITLERILDIRHVNAIKNGSTIPFAHPGMTVVYGQNGSGKSSYARILKRACRARDTKEPIHPNVFDPNEKGPASATIKISDGATSDIKLSWVDGQHSDERLAQVTFFDSKCARVIVDASNEAVYIPYGCQTFDGLVDLIKDFRSRLQNESLIPIEPDGAGTVIGTKSRLFLQELSRNTTPEEIADATAWTELDEETLAGVTTRIAQSKTKESLEKARRFRSSSLRSGELLAAIARAVEALSAERASTIDRHFDHLLAAETAVQVTAQMSLTGEPLPSGRANQWRLLYEAARDYSTGVAYPDKPFPATGPGEVCVLCQQPIGGEARDRFQRFKAFMEDKTKQTLEQARDQCATAAATLRDLQLPRASDYINVLDELSVHDRERVECVLTDLRDERARWVAAIANETKIGAAKEFDDTNAALSGLKAQLDAAALQAEHDADPNTLQRLERSRDELSSRKSMNLAKGVITTYVEQKRLQFIYDECIKTLNTRSISAKSKEIISAALTPQLQGDLRRELKALGAEHLPLNVNITGREGGAHHQLTLVATARQAKLSEVLSEGEHCVVAIAGFLAELGGTTLRSPIVLDDPVSSLDHRYCRLIAKRLVEEAKRRQVIVFTHNIAFLVEIQKHCAGSPLCVQHVQRMGAVPGHCIEGLPWEALPVSDRLKYIDDHVNESAKLYGVDDNKYNEQAAHLYGLLRQTWEACIEHELLNRCVRRHDTDVQTQRLMEVEIQDADCGRIQEGMSKCSTWMAGHDKSAALDVNRPPPSELRADMQELRDFAKLLKTRRATTEGRRKAILKPQASTLG